MSDIPEIMRSYKWQLHYSPNNFPHESVRIVLSDFCMETSHNRFQKVWLKRLNNLYLFKWR